MLRPETLGTALHDVDRILMISSARERLLETQCTFIDASKKAGVRHIFKFSGQESGIGFNAQNFRSTREHEEISSLTKRTYPSMLCLKSAQIGVHSVYRMRRRMVMGTEPSGRGATFQESSSPFIS